MPEYHKLAKELNDVIEQESPMLWSLLSEKGKAMYFPKEGILGQTAEAASTKWNATIGIALEADGSPMRLPSIDRHTDIPPKDVYPYASSYGKKEFRAKWREMIYQKNPSLKADISVPVVVAGLTHALSMVGYMFLDPSDSVLLPDLYWGNYVHLFTYVYGTKLCTCRTFDGEAFDVASLRTALGEEKGKHILLLNFPNNPTGYTPTDEEARSIVAAVRERAEAGERLLIILDDAYFGLVYEEGIAKESLFAPLADLHENVVVLKVDGPTKEDYVWGHRVGCLTFAGKGITKNVLIAMESKIAGAVRSTVSNVSHLAQSTLLAAYTSPTYAAEKMEKYDLLAERYHTVRAVLKNPKFSEVFRPLPYNSGYFMCVELKHGLDAEAIRKRLIQEFNTGVIALGNKFRIAYSSVSEEHIPTLFENLYRACSS